MKRLSALMLGACMLAVPMFASGAVAGASTAAPSAIKGSYVVQVSYDSGASWHPFTMTLNKNGTGIDNFGDPINWSLTGKAFQMSIQGPNPAVYHGKKTTTGLCKQSKPGTVTSGPSVGIWYATKNT